MQKKIIIIVSICSFVIVFMSLFEIYVPVDIKNNKTVLIEIPAHFNATEIAGILKNNKVIRSSLVFKILITVTSSSKKLKAGEYELSPSMNVLKIFDAIRSGKSKVYMFSVPEGTTVNGIAYLLEEQKLGNKEKFLELVRDKSLCEYYNIPAGTVEGYLFPDTYDIAKGVPEKEILNRMINRFYEVFDESMRQQAEQMHMTVHQIVTFASIIEKEAAVEEEREIISAVFHNRLRKGLNLSSCATVLYAIGKPKKRLYDKDVKINSVYNTYINSGLPPAPICCPGKNSLIAALNPAKADYLYFVANGDGTHTFSRTYKEHRSAQLRNKYKNRR